MRVWEESEKPLFPKKTRDLISQTYSVSRARPRVTVDSETLHPSVILAAEMKRMEPSMRSSWNLDDQVIALDCIDLAEIRQTGSSVLGMGHTVKDGMTTSNEKEELRASPVAEALHAVPYFSLKLNLGFNCDKI